MMISWYLKAGWPDSATCCRSPIPYRNNFLRTIVKRIVSFPLKRDGSSFSLLQFELSCGHVWLTESYVILSRGRSQWLAVTYYYHCQQSQVEYSQTLASSRVKGLACETVCVCVCVCECARLQCVLFNRIVEMVTNSRILPQVCNSPKLIPLYGTFSYEKKCKFLLH